MGNKKTVLTSFGETIRKLREAKSLTLKTVAFDLGIDTSLLGKIERNDRPPTKDFIKQVADYYNVDETELNKEFMSDLIAYKLLDENNEQKILKVAEKKVSYLKKMKNG
jgi:HTH-type transcriptional regulator, competence development regulator